MPGYESTLRRALKNDDECELMVMVEETYHTRILVSTALSYGIEVKSAYQPPTALRGLITTIVKTPKAIARPLTLAAEVLAVLMFSNLLEKSRVVLRHDPELRDSVEERLCEILTDEIGHMSYNRACIGPVGMMQARAVLPHGGPRAVRRVPGNDGLGDHVLGVRRRGHVARDGHEAARAGRPVRVHLLKPGGREHEASVRLA